MHFYYLVFYASSGVVMCFSGARVSFAMFLLIIEVFYWFLLFAFELVFNLKQFFFFFFPDEQKNYWMMLVEAPTCQTDNHSWLHG